MMEGAAAGPGGWIAMRGGRQERKSTAAGREDGFVDCSLKVCAAHAAHAAGIQQAAVVINYQHLDPDPPPTPPPPHATQ